MTEITKEVNIIDVNLEQDVRQINLSLDASGNKLDLEVKPELREIAATIEKQETKLTLNLQEEVKDISLKVTKGVSEEWVEERLQEFSPTPDLTGLVEKPEDWGDGSKFLSGDGTLKEVSSSVEYGADEGIELDGTTFKLTEDTKESLSKADSALQTHQSLTDYAKLTDVPSDINELSDSSNLLVDTTYTADEGIELIGTEFKLTQDTKDKLEKASTAIQEHQSLENYAEKSEIPKDLSDLTDIEGLLSEEPDLSEYAKTSEIPTKNSQLENDEGFVTSDTTYTASRGIELTGTEFKLTQDTQDSLNKADSALQEHQSLEDYAKTSDVPTDINELSDSSNLLVDTTYTADEGIELDGTTFILNEDTKASLEKADTALQEHQNLDDYVLKNSISRVGTTGNYINLVNAPKNPTVTGSYTAFGDSNLIILKDSNGEIINLENALDLEIGDVISLGLTENKTKRGSKGVAWTGVCEHRGNVFYCTNGKGIWLDKGDSVKKITNSTRNYTSITSFTYDLIYGTKTIVASEYGGGLYRIDFDPETETATETKLLGTNNNRNWVQLIDWGLFMLGIAKNQDIYMLTFSDDFVISREPIANTAQNKSWSGGHYWGQGFLALEGTTGKIWQWTGSSFVDSGMGNPDYVKMIQPDYSSNFSYILDDNGKWYKFDSNEETITEMEGFKIDDAGGDGFIFDTTGQGDYVRGSSVLGIQTLDEVPSEGKLHTVEFIGDDQPYPIGSIIVNYEHCGTRGNGSLKLNDETETQGVTIERFKKWHDAPLGLGQAWVSFGYQALNVGMINSTNRMISIAAGARVRDAKVTIVVDGVKVAETMDTYSSVTLPRASDSALIPAGASYQVTWYGHLNNANNFNFWSELR